jgi:TFIIF-interacting CTD phosphatase-like protein
MNIKIDFVSSNYHWIQIIMSAMGSKLIVFDLDETLLHCSYRKLFQYKEANYLEIGGMYVYPRPGLQNMLQQLVQIYRIGIWTAKHKDYALPIIEKLIKVPLDLIFTSDRCTDTYQISGSSEYDMGFTPVRRCYKRLRKVKKKLNMSLQDILIVDNTAQTFCKNYGNGILVLDFIGDPHDQVLFYLSEFLINIKDRDDFRKVCKTQNNWLPT